jgi:aspartate-semialdehyde dehydrogenase
MKKIKVGILGATGMVGQNYIRLLENHPWFDVAYVAASSNSAGVKYSEAVKGRWQMTSPIPKNVAKLMVEDVSNIEKAKNKCDFVFSAFEISDKNLVKETEEKYAEAGIPVVSNASANRWTPDVPMLLPEINASHTDIIATQKKNHGWSKGFITVKPNCSLQSYLTPIYALNKAGFPISKDIYNYSSGSFWCWISWSTISLDMIDNVVPFIGGEKKIKLKTNH